MRLEISVNVHACQYVAVEVSVALLRRFFNDGWVSFRSKGKISLFTRSRPALGPTLLSSELPGLVG
jgi:hypothetical protein